MSVPAVAVAATLICLPSVEPDSFSFVAVAMLREDLNG